jgi:putative PIN family toxin of toxin-antitoxin system
VINFLHRSFIKIIPQGTKPTICRDDDDNNILLLANSVKADIIITGDDDLLILDNYKNIKIIKPREFIEKYEI